MWRFLPVALGIVLAVASRSAAAISFDYHGTLRDAGVPAEGRYDVELTLYSAADGGRVIAGPLTLANVAVHEGAFSTQADFGALAQPADNAWLGVRLRSAGSGDFSALPARSAVALTATSVCPGAWTIGGNAGNPAGSYVGTADSQPLVLKTNGAAAITISPPAVGIANAGTNIILGDSANSIAPGVVGAVIAGGGDGLDSEPNTIGAGADLGFIGGGSKNQVNGGFSAVVGGGGNTVNGSVSIVLGGFGNIVGSHYSLAAGYTANVRASDTSTFVWSDGFNTLSSNGSNEFVIGADGGVSVDGVPYASNVELTVHASRTPGAGDNNADLVMLARGASLGTDLVAAPDGSFSVFSTPSFASLLSVDSSGNLAIAGANAYKATSGSWLASSDRRIKQDVEPLASAVDTLSQLRPVSFHYTPAYREQHGNFADRTFFGFIAQEYAEVFPEAVASQGERVPGAPDAEPPVLSLDVQPALITAVAAVQELAQQAHDLRDENAALRRKVDDLAARLARLEARER